VGDSHSTVCRGEEEEEEEEYGPGSRRRVEEKSG